MGISSLMSALWTLILIALSILVGHAVEVNAEVILKSLALPSFLAIPLGSQAEMGIIRVLAGVLGGFLAFFLLAYIMPAILDAVRLGRVLATLDKEGANRLQAGSPPPSWEWHGYPLFAKLWRDFTKNLQGRAGSEPGGTIVYRASAPAELFFNTQILVDIPMRVEFFRHLPGIFTGAGIVSTFAGVLLGLTEFDPMVAPDQVTSQLKHLFTGVSTAFVASFFAITLSIVVTIIEKLLLQWRYGQVILLQGAIDELFTGGEVETIPHAAPPAPPEISSQQLLQNIGQLGQEVALAISTQVGAQLSDKLGEPLTQISRLIQTMVTDQREREVRAQALEQLLGGMGDKMDVVLTSFTEGTLRMGEELAGSRHNLDASFNNLLTLMNDSRQQETSASGQLVGQLDQALQKGEAIRDGVLQLNDELTKQSDKIAAWGEKTTQFLLGELTREIRSLTEVAKEAAKERDAFLLARLDATQGELSRNFRESVTAGVAMPMQEIVTGLQTLREEQEQQGRQLSEALLNAFAAHLRQTVASLVAKLTELGDRISQEREALQSTIRNLLDGMTEVAKQGGDHLADQMARATSNAEVRQNAVLDALTRFSADMRVDLNLLQDRIRATSREVSDQLMEHTRELSQQGLAESDAHLRNNTDRLANDLKETLRVLASEGIERRRELESALLGRLDAGTAQLVDRILHSFQDVTRLQEENDQAREARLAEQIRSGTTELGDQLGSQFRVVVEHFDHNLAQREEERAIREELLAEQLEEKIVKTTRETGDQVRIAINTMDSNLGRRDSERNSHEQAREERLANQVRDNVGDLANQMRDNVGDLANQVRGNVGDLANELRQVFQKEIQQASQGVAGTIRESEAKQQAMARQLSDMLLVAMASKVEDTFGGLANGLNDLSTRFQDERQTIQQALNHWMEDLKHTSEAGSDQLATKIQQVMAQAAASHQGMLDALKLVGNELSNDLDKMQTGILAKHAESTQQVVQHMDEVVSTTSQEQSRFIEVMIERVDALRQRLRIK